MTSEATAGQVPDIYGQVHPVETPELISKKLADFDDWIEEEMQSKKKKNDTSSLEEAMEKCPGLLTKDFKLKFLRSEVFNTDLAAIKYIQYWSKRVNLFQEKAFLPLTVHNLLVDDKVALERGFIKLMPGVTDEKGRSIVYTDGSLQDFSLYTHESICRVIWYIFHAALERESTQKYGVIMLSDPSRAKLSQFDRKFAKMFADYTQGTIPCRLAAIHVCKPPMFVSTLFPVIRLFLAERVRNRLVVHAGTKDDKLHKSLEKYHVTPDMLPAELSGNVKFEYLDWLAERRSKGL